MLSFDTETTGLSTQYGCKPFFVSVCYEDGTQQWWEWEVDGVTRQPIIPLGDLKEIADVLGVVKKWGEWPDPEIQERHKVVGQNIGFDVKAMSTLGSLFQSKDWPWKMTHDTLIASHILASNQPHNLTALAMQYLGIDILPLEKALEVAVKKARTLCKNQFPDWRIAKEGVKEIPSAKGQEKLWQNDYWLPRACMLGWQRLVEKDQIGYRRSAQEQLDEYHSWWTVLSEYSNADSAITLALWKMMKEELIRKGYWEIYLHKMHICPAIVKMEQGGFSLRKDKLREMQTLFSCESESARGTCTGIARSYGYNLSLPKSGNNDSLIDFCFGSPQLDKNGKKIRQLRCPNPTSLMLPVVARTDTGGPSLDSKRAIPAWQSMLPEHSKHLTFVNALAASRKFDTALGFMEAYERFMLPIEGISQDTNNPLWYRVFPSINQTGTDTTRMSSSNPNGQQISKQENECIKCHGEGCIWCSGSGKSLLSLRRMFGPAPGREMYSLDYENIELRIPAYKSKQKELINLFEHPDDPPYFGSNHLLYAHILHTEMFEACEGSDGKIDGRIFKKKYVSTWYQWTKNGDFAVQYQAGSETADRAYHLPGARDKIKQKLVALDALNTEMCNFANRHGYILTEQGYPLLCTRMESGKILNTVPLSYYVQGTAGGCLNAAIVRVDEFFEECNRQEHREPLEGYRIALPVHDEIVCDFPLDSVATHERNVEKAKEVRRLMSLSGDDIKVPLSVSCNWHPECWAEGETVK